MSFAVHVRLDALGQLGVGALAPQGTPSVLRSPLQGMLMLTTRFRSGRKKICTADSQYVRYAITDSVWEAWCAWYIILIRHASMQTRYS